MGFTLNPQLKLLFCQPHRICYENIVEIKFLLKNTQIHKILQFPSISFLILKFLHDSFIINVMSYIFFKILVQ